ncbi:flagellar biosynthesis/type III secretory pathway-like protein [Clostridium sp. Sa3CUN1]|uniref:Flagellar biosynthesis/type III secretory pathway-like protein n=1 Tax=Clostridium gallinarum TaxID=2762246 RepID=A0ABR8Q4I9_9CLOT|nr:flagellar biosynthesis/type III secretory pathway-like protein [Clostridium gallinarum]MBD7915327.1 flagellar biosynthesis/type III secretory pathway-like protein [Clostridium gallinarum]
MQLSYNLIKNTSALKSSQKTIATNYISRIEAKDIEKEKLDVEQEIRKSYEVLGSNIIKKAKSEAEDIVMRARVISAEIEKKAYEEGYNQGKSNGFEDGYKEALVKVKSDTNEKVKVRIDEAEEILKSANKEYLEYLNLKEEEIINLAFKMASIIAKKELQKDDGIIPLMEDVLEGARAEENIIIRCNTKHVKGIEEKIEYYKKAYAIKGDIFILEDTLMELGNAIIEKNTGKAVVGLDVALEKLETALFK